MVALPGMSLTGPNGGYIVWVIGFLSGFSERFVQDFVAQANRIVTPGAIGSGDDTKHKS